MISVRVARDNQQPIVDIGGLVAERGDGADELLAGSDAEFRERSATGETLPKSARRDDIRPGACTRRTRRRRRKPSRLCPCRCTRGTRRARPRRRRSDTPLTKKCTTLAAALTATATCVHTSTSTTVADAMLAAHSPAVCDDTNATEPFACAPQHPTPVPPHASITAQPDSPCETIICVLLTLDVLIQASTVSSPVALTACLNSLLSSVLYTDMAVSAEKSSDIAVWSFRYIDRRQPVGIEGNTMSPVDVDVAEFLTRNSTATPSWVSTISASAASYRAIGAWSGW